MRTRESKAMIMRNTERSEVGQNNIKKKKEKERKAKGSEVSF